MRLCQNNRTQNHSIHIYRKLWISYCAAAIALAVFGAPASAVAQVAPTATTGTPSQAVSVDVLSPPLEEVNAALKQVQIERWKVSRDWKAQFSNDANSIEQDLSGTLPGLLQTARQSPAALGPQLAVMHNVDALYDVLVRLTTAANLCGGKTDAALLDNALKHLENAHKSAAGELLQSASFQDQEIVKFQSQLRTTETQTASGNRHNKVIVVDNRVTTHKTTHHKTAPRTTMPQTHPNTGP